MSNPSRAAAASRPSRPSPMHSLPVRRLKEILSRVVPDATLGPVEEMPSTQLSRLYSLRMSDDRQLLFSFAPSLSIRLLRQEASLLSSEAILVHLVSNSECRDTEMTGSPHSETEPPHGISLPGLVPKLLKHSSNNREMAYPYSIFEQTVGEMLSTQSIYLSISERRLVDKQIGLMARALASHTSPSRTFGTMTQVLPNPYMIPTPNYLPPTGVATWSEAFNNLLEGILRDGEDMTVLLPYETIRAHYRRLSLHLDTITQPRLVVLDAGSETNVMVDRGQHENASTSTVRISGLRSWSQGVFGDPLICDAFENPSEGFLEGWQEGGGSEDVIEDAANTEVRLLLYRCYRAVWGIVTEYFRPQPDSSRRELEGRRNLTSVLAELEKVDAVESDVLKRARSSSGEPSDEQKAKRTKVDDEEKVGEQQI